MSDSRCKETQIRLALGEAYTDHLSHCEECRSEAEKLSLLFEEMRRTADMEPPAELDRMILEQISEVRPKTHALLRFLPAVALAVVAMLSVGIGLTLAFGETSLAKGAPVISIVLLFVYFAVSLTALLPVLVRRKSLKSRDWSAPVVSVRSQHV